MCSVQRAPAVCEEFIDSGGGVNRVRRFVVTFVPGSILSSVGCNCCVSLPGFEDEDVAGVVGCCNGARGGSGC